MKGGWYNESARHSLAARGYGSIYLKRKHPLQVDTLMHRFDARKPGHVGMVHGVPMYADKLKEGMVYPITPEAVRKVFGRMPPEDLKGMNSVEFVDPKGEQNGAWAQYVRSKRKILIFGQPVRPDGTIDGEEPEMLRKHIELYVLPHEVGHHKALYHDKITDKHIEVAEARADANVVGMAPDDKAVKQLVRKG